MILVIDTHAEDIFVGLWNRDSDKWKTQETFLGGRQLNSLILAKLPDIKKADLTDIIVAAGPGSFTGLRIGISVANTLAYALNIPIVAPPETTGVEDLLKQGLKLLEKVEPEFSRAVIPFYGAAPHITKPKS